MVISRCSKIVHDCIRAVDTVDHKNPSSKMCPVGISRLKQTCFSLAWVNPQKSCKSYSLIFFPFFMTGSSGLTNFSKSNKLFIVFGDETPDLLYHNLKMTFNIQICNIILPPGSINKIALMTIFKSKGEKSFGHAVFVLCFLSFLCAVLLRKWHINKVYLRYIKHHLHVNV